MTTNTQTKLLQYLNDHNQASPKELGAYLGISQQALFKQLAKLLQKEQIIKSGRSPRVVYQIKTTLPASSSFDPNIDKESKQIIDDNFLTITAIGEKQLGWTGFVSWCAKNNQPLLKTANEYIKTLAKYDKFKKDGLVDGFGKLKNTFNQVFLDKLFYLDFYSIERFGKTKLGQLLLYAKQSQNKLFIRELIQDIKPKIAEIIKKYKIDGIGFIPPTVKREVQLMKELENHLSLTIKKIPIKKLRTEVTVPQKTLNKLSDRIENAQKTIIVDDAVVYRNILLIDDAVGSGSTLNETAAQIKQKKLCRGQIIGLAITGSFKGFDVISEV